MAEAKGVTMKVVAQPDFTPVIAKLSELAEAFHDIASTLEFAAKALDPEPKENTDA